MSDLIITDPDGTLASLLSERAKASGRPPGDLAREALLSGLMWSPAKRTAEAERIRRAARPPLDGQAVEDSTTLIRRLRDGG